jgi:anti-sigma-K factor RskA
MYARFRDREWQWSDALEKRMDWWSLAPYWVPAIAAVIAVVVLVGAARARAARRSARPRQGASAAVDQSYLDSSHIGEPEAGFDVGAAGKLRRGRR